MAGWSASKGEAREGDATKLKFFFHHRIAREIQCYSDMHELTFIPLKFMFFTHNIPINVLYV
jgi:hypothetical protein